MKRTSFFLNVTFFSAIFVAICLICGLTALMIPGNKNEQRVAASTDLFSVIIDAGHGGEDCGAVGVDGTTLEKDINLSVALYLGRLLEKEGVNVIYTRTADILLYDKNTDYMGRKKSLDLKARLAVFEKSPDSIFVSIHMNSFVDPKYRGMQVYYSRSDDQSRILAESIQQMSLFLLPENKRKIKEADSSIYLLDRASGTAVLVECGFLSNSQECAQLKNDEFQKKIAFSLFRGIMDYKDAKTT